MKKNVKTEIATLLKQFGIAREIRGYAYMVDAIALLVERTGVVSDE